MFDAYGALAYSADLSFVDEKRVAVMGWGRSTVLGAVAETGTRTLFEKTFRAAVAFYPDCGYTTSGRFSAPVMVLIGAKDDWTPAVLCERMAKASRGSPAVVEITVYPEAHHSFDDPDIGALYSYGEAENEHKSPARGATLGYHRESHEDATRRVREFLSARLR